jgi:hypothetical protein
MGEFLPDEMIDDLIRRLNIVNSEHSEWKIKRAMKKHLDLFGKEIEIGDNYYRLSIDFDFGNDLKLSAKSMELFLYAIFAAVPKWNEEIDRYGDNKKIKKLESYGNIREILNKLRGGD